MTARPTRRRFLGMLSFAAAAALARVPRSRAAAGALETTTVRLAKSPVICIAPQYVCDTFLRAEGFTDIRYVESPVGLPYFQAMVRGDLDFTSTFAMNWLTAIDAGAPATVVAGVHAGCYQLYAQNGIRSITELKGKTVGLETSPAYLLELIAAEVGLDPAHDIHWITAADSAVKPLELFAQGKIDAFLGFPPEPQELRARGVGHVIVDTAIDRPWSQYFCCMLGAERSYVRKYPEATKRVVRAMLKATDLCVSDPPAVARNMVEAGFTERYDYALQTVKENPYNVWREYDAEDTLRFYALRMRDAGMIKATPQQIIAEHTDWHFLDQVKRELKA